MVLLTKEGMDADKPITVLNIPPLRFIGGTTRQVRTGNIQGAWYPEKSVSVITTVGVPVKEALDDIGMRYRNVVIHMDCDGKASLERSLGELWPTQSLDKWVDWINNQPPGDEVNNMNWLITVSPSSKKNDGRLDPGISSWG